MTEEAEGRTEHIEAAARVWAWARWERQWREGEVGEAVAELG